MERSTRVFRTLGQYYKHKYSVRCTIKIIPGGSFKILHMCTITQPNQFYMLIKYIKLTRAGPPLILYIPF